MTIHLNVLAHNSKKEIASSLCEKYAVLLNEGGLFIAFQCELLERVNGGDVQRTH